MEPNRRRWLKQIGLSVAGVGLANLSPFASPTQVLSNYSGKELPIKLSSNENPYGPSPMARKAMIENIPISNRYNWELTNELIETIAKRNKVSANNILMGAGSTEIIDIVARFSANKKRQSYYCRP
jgi:histidinol-phosphate aminotransferase